MRKFLIVSFTSGEKYTGGMVCSKRNYDSLVAIFGKENVFRYVIQPYKEIHLFKSKIKRIIDIFRGYMGGLTLEKEREIHELITTNNITDVFIDSSLLGLAAMKIKQKFPYIRITTFFHNFEKGFIYDHIKINKDYIRIYWAILTDKNERSAVKYSDVTICLNDRDRTQLEACYGRKMDAMIPITVQDNYFENQNIDVLSENKEALFLGSYFFGNVQGIKWFYQNVMPHVNINLTIIGASMNKLNEDFDVTSNIKILSDVPDLKPYFEQADFVILPILSGSGMKVKTAESLMYGKYIIGTDEAFRGYAITNKEGIRCNSVDEFITAINNLDLKHKFNVDSRRLYESKYSFKSSLDAFRKALKA